MRRSIQAIVTSALVLLISSRVGSAEQVQLVVDGRARTYLLERPPAQGPRPTIIMLHGYTGSASHIAQQTGLAEPAKQAGFVAVFPEGLAGRWNLLPPSKQTARYVQLFQSGGGVPDDVAVLHVILPESLPYVFAGVRIGAAVSWAVVVSAELIAAQQGLGYIIMDAATFFRIPAVYVGISLIGIIGFAIDRLISFAERRLVHWSAR